MQASRSLAATTCRATRFARSETGRSASCVAETRWTARSQEGCVCGHIWEVHWDGEGGDRKGCYHCSQASSSSLDPEVRADICTEFRQRCGYHSRAWGARCDLEEGHDPDCVSAGDGFKGGYIPGEETW